jgi:tRNA nucleotidyltransferase (CCA-adding enzyme)
LGFGIEEDTFCAVKELCGNINKVSRERIHAELNKILLSERPDHVMQLYETGLTKEILPVVHEILGGKRSKITCTMLKVSEENLILRYAALMQEADEKNVFETMKSLKLDNYTIDTVTMLVKYSKDDIAENEPGVREAIHKYGRDFFPLLLKHQKMILQAKEAVTDIMLSERKRHIDTLDRMYLEIIRRGDCISVKDLDINGTDLMEYGLQGPRIGATLNELLHIVMENPKLNDKEILISMIENR